MVKKVVKEVTTCGLQVLTSLSFSITLLLSLNLCYNSTHRKKQLQVFLIPFLIDDFSL